MYRQRNKLITRYRGLSTDTKPQHADHGSTFHEMDTGTVYCYDKTGGEWYEVPGGEETYVLKTVSGNSIIVSDALAARIKSLVASHATTQSGVPAPDSPAGIVCNNGTLKWDPVNHRVYADGTPNVVSVCGKNLVNVATNVKDRYISASGVISADTGTIPNSQYTDLIPVKVGEKYTWSMISNRTKAGNNRCHGYDANGAWVQQVDFAEGGAGGVAFSLTVTIPSGVSCLRLSYGINDTDVMLEKGAAKTDYEAYSGQVATVENLLALGENQDEQEIIRGVVTRKTGIHVFDGTEQISASGTYTGCIMYTKANHGWDVDTDIIPLCTHFEGLAKEAYKERHSGQCFLNKNSHFYFCTDMSLNEFQAFLAAQYAANTPLMVIYALAHENTEHVTAQPLSAYSGTTAVNANNGTTITMTYKAEKGE